MNVRSVRVEVGLGCEVVREEMCEEMCEVLHSSSWMRVLSSHTVQWGWIDPSGLVDQGEGIVRVITPVTSERHQDLEG